MILNFTNQLNFSSGWILILANHENQQSGIPRSNIMKIIGIIMLIFSFHKTVISAEEALDVEFLEWLGQTAEIEDLGMDIGKLIESQEQPDTTNDVEEVLK